jgi:hypothetical protein
VPLSRTRFYPSDEIRILVGFDGSESREVRAWRQMRCADFPIRAVFAINQHYPELNSGCYENKALVGLIQEGLAECGIAVVIEDNYRRDGLVPAEPPGSLTHGDDYLLVSDTLDVRGRMRLWQSLGGMSVFCHDDLIMEIVTGADEAACIVQSVRRLCDAAGVSVLDPPGAPGAQPESPVHRAVASVANSIWRQGPLLLLLLLVLALAVAWIGNTVYCARSTAAEAAKVSAVFCGIAAIIGGLVYLVSNRSVPEMSRPPRMVVLLLHATRYALLAGVIGFVSGLTLASRGGWWPSVMVWSLLTAGISAGVRFALFGYLEPWARRSTR